MKMLLLLSGLLLFLGVANLPIGYYTFLRIVIFVASILIIIDEHHKGGSLGLLLFILSAILFNPIIPIYFYSKSIWVPIDIFFGIVFSIKALINKE